MKIERVDRLAEPNASTRFFVGVPSRMQPLALFTRSREEIDAKGAEYFETIRTLIRQSRIVAVAEDGPGTVKRGQVDILSVQEGLTLSPSLP